MEEYNLVLEQLKIIKELTQLIDGNELIKSELIKNIDSTIEQYLEEKNVIIITKK